MAEKSRQVSARAWVLAIIAFSPLAAAAGENAGTLSFVLENDLFYNQDRNYTNGVQVSWVPQNKAPPGWAVQFARRIPWFPEKGRVRHGYGFGQSMFTPYDITLIDPPTQDRPYAGWLFAGTGLGVETGQQLDQLALILGVVGPASLAEQSQKFIHRVVGADRPRGWDRQLKNEPGIVLTYQRSWRQLATTTLAGSDLDVTPHMGGALGNVFTYASAGLTLRYGRPLPLDFGPPRIQPSLPGSPLFQSRKGFAWYLFAGTEGRAVARNIFLDGNTFHNSPSVEKKPLVGDVQFGIVLEWYDVRLSYTHVFRSREFETQTEDHDFGAFSLSISLPD